ncbi:MAG: sensor histidine kinase, partial [Chloroflexota bacterium]|nr:sensor histidine kinase [Chloroflexota bacterium]
MQPSAEPVARGDHDAVRAPTALRTQRERLIRSAWLLYLALAVAALVVAVPLTFRHAKLPCASADCGGQLTLGQVQGLAAVGIPAHVFTGYLLAVLLIVPVAGLTLATLLIWRKPTDRMALSVALFFGTCTLNVTGMPGTLAARYPALDVPLRLFFISAYGFVPLFTIFPDGRFVPRWARWLAFVQLALAVTNWLMPSRYAAGTTLAALTGLWMPLYGLAAVGFQVYRYRRVADMRQCQQIKWVVSGMALVVLYGLGMALVPATWSASWVGKATQVTLGTLLITILMLTFAIALVRHRLFDIDLIINRTLVYGLLTGSVVGIYALVVGTLGTLLQARGSFVVSLLAAGVVAVAFQPLRDRLQRGVNRWLYGRRDEPYDALAQLGNRLETTLAPEAILPVIVETVRATLKLPYVAITLTQNDGRGTLQAAAGVASAPPTPLPLVYQGTEIGQLLVTPRAGEAALSRADHGLLSALARHAGIAAYAVRLTGDLQHAREQLVVAREEERRRLRRDLHDGLGPSLATMTLQADTARGLLRGDPDAAEALLSELTAQTQTTMQEIRRLIHALRPPVLDDLGLVAALRALAASFSHGGAAITIEAPAALPPLPAAVEVAAYRIAQEALANVAKHAQARHCVVSLQCDAALRLRVSDDGRGIPDPHAGISCTRGVGFASMRERAEELGGTCRIEPGEGGGTVVSVALPLRGNNGPDPGADR